MDVPCVEAATWWPEYWIKKCLLQSDFDVKIIHSLIYFNNFCS